MGVHVLFLSWLWIGSSSWNLSTMQSCELLVGCLGCELFVAHIEKAFSFMWRGVFVGSHDGDRLCASCDTTLSAALARLWQGFKAWFETGLVRLVQPRTGTYVGLVQFKKPEKSAFAFFFFFCFALFWMQKECLLDCYAVCRKKIV